MLLETINNKNKIISIVGLAKNTGKTVALNYLIGEAIDEGVRLGVVSIGRDGESMDLVTRTEKPKIYVEEGTIIVTTTTLLSLSDATVEIMKITDYRTPLGKILIGKVKDSGYVQISGPQTAKEVKEISKLLLSFGVDLVIIDGALDRKSSAAPSISEATILSTGAVLSRDMNKVIEETVHAVNIFGLSQVKDDKDRRAIEEVLDKGEVAIIDHDLSTSFLKIKTALNSGRVIGYSINDNSKHIVIPGSLTKNTLDDIITTTDKYKNVDIVITDGTKVFIPPKDWLRFMRSGVNVKVLNPINLVAITLNPYAPQGYYFNPSEFLHRMRHFIKDIPVVDVVLGDENIEIYG